MSGMTQLSGGLQLVMADGPVTPDLSAGFDRAETTIGRGDAADIQLDHQWVSRVHAVIRGEEGNWHIEDANSTTGTRVDSMRIEQGEQMPMHDGMVIEIGPW
ncbi:MAG: FHA domain-containing protein [Phycisphaerales bacterium]|nr:FHA domain-containing protein [Phycisphaerales bacterium]